MKYAMQYGLGLLGVAVVFAGILLFDRWRHRKEKPATEKSAKFKGYPNTVDELVEYRRTQWALRDGLEQVKEPEIIEPDVDVLLFDSIKRRWGPERVDGSVVKELKKTFRHLGRQWNYEGKLVYAINKYLIERKDQAGKVVALEEHYRPVDILMSETRETPPTEVYTAICQDEVGVYFDVREQKSLLQKLVPVLIFVFACLMVMFIWSQSPKT